MDKIDALIVAIQRELKRHNWDYFSEEVEPGGRRVTVPGCSTCRKRCDTTTQFIEHLADEAIPALFARLRAPEVEFGNEVSHKETTHEEKA